MLFGYEIHPAIVHFPIALGCVGALASLVYLFVRREWLRLFAPILLTLALLGAGAAYFSGKAAGDRAEKAHVPENAVDEHEESGLWAAGILALAVILTWATHTKRRGEWVGTIIALMAMAALLRTGYLGGHLVFKYGAGHVVATPSGDQPAGAGTQTPEPDHD